MVLLLLPDQGGSSSEGGAGNHGVAKAGEGGDPILGGSSSAQGGSAADGESGGEVVAAGVGGSGAGGADLSAGGAGDGCLPDGEGGAPDLGETATVCATGPILCTPDKTLAASGNWSITGTNTVVALSDTTVLVGNQLNNRLDVLDLCTGKTRWSWQLPAAPGTSVFDRARRLLYVTLAGATGIAKVPSPTTTIGCRV